MPGPEVNLEPELRHCSRRFCFCNLVCRCLSLLACITIRAQICFCTSYFAVGKCLSRQGQFENSPARQCREQDLPKKNNLSVPKGTAEYSVFPTVGLWSFLSAVPFGTYCLQPDTPPALSCWASVGSSLVGLPEKNPPGQKQRCALTSTL